MSFTFGWLDVRLCERRMAMKLFVGALLGFCASGQTYDMPHSMDSNVKYKLDRLGIADQVTLGEVHKKNVSVTQGAELLWDICLSDPDNWKIDQVWGRLAHSHPFSTKSCREIKNPSLHMIFRKLDDGQLKAELHHDGHGPVGVFPHLDEFLFHKVTLSDNNLQRMGRNIVKSYAPKAKFITNEERTMLYVQDTFSTRPVASYIAVGMFRHYLRQTIYHSERHYQPLLPRFEGAMFRHTIYNSVEYGVATWRHEDTRLKPSREEGFNRRLGYSLKRAFIVDTPTGTEPAYARFAAILGTRASVYAWHPWRNYDQNPTYQLSFGLGIVVARSIWAEFGPDLKRDLKKKYRKL